MSDTGQGKIPLHIVAGDDRQVGADKIARNRAQFEQDAPKLRKPPWIRVRLPAGNAVGDLKLKLRDRQLFTVCEEATCPNIHECFSKGTATFMILGAICTRRCSFCDVAHGRPLPPDPAEADQLAATVRDMGLRYVVITSVDRDDLRDGGAGHFAACIGKVRAANPGIHIEILVPDFRGKGRLERALELLADEPPDVFNHNVETVEALYRNVRPGADYRWSLDLLARFKRQHPQIPTKSGIMLGLGEELDQVMQTLQDLRNHDVDLVTIGQYLQPTAGHHPVLRYWTPEEFAELGATARAMGFTHVACGPLVRSSYHADAMAHASGLIGVGSEAPGELP
jgi:lipoic acid synthetase